MSAAHLPSQPSSYRVLSRRRALVWFAAATLFGGLAGWWVQDYLVAYLGELEQIAEQDRQGAARSALTVLRTILGAMTCLLWITGSYLARYGYVSLRSGRFPPPGAWIIEGRPGLTGSRATWAGWGHIGIGVALIACGCFALLYTWVLLPRILLPGAGIQL